MTLGDDMTDQPDKPAANELPSVRFFETQFQRQIQESDFGLNPFETVAFDYVFGDVLDLGCGLGNLSLEVAKRGCKVTAVDGSPSAVSRIQRATEEGSLPIEAVLADLATYVIPHDFDTVVAIGLLMFFRRDRALAILDEIKSRVRTGGRAVVNVLVEGTTSMDMFDPGNYCLLDREELLHHFADWNVLVWRPETYSAPRGTVKEFSTLIAEKPRPIPKAR